MDGREIRTAMLMRNGKFRKIFNSITPRIEIILVREDRQHNRAYVTYGRWHIESGFLITYSPTGRRAARKIPSDTKAIYERGNRDALR